MIQQNYCVHADLNGLEPTGRLRELEHRAKPRERSRSYTVSRAAACPGLFDYVMKKNAREL